MEDRMPVLSPQIPARENAKSPSMTQEGPSTSSQESNKVLDKITGKKHKEFQEETSTLISQKLPHAPKFLKERIAVSISQRQALFLKWHQRDLEASSCGKESRTLSAFEAKDSHKPIELPGNSNPSAKILKLGSEENFDFLEPPRLESSQSHFKCPICFLALPVESTKRDLWRQHVMRDLQPFICVLETCSKQQTEFGTYGEWIQHMREEQRDSASDLFLTCPLCSHGLEEYTRSHSAMDGQELLLQHIARHLLSLALLFLPQPHTNAESPSKPRDSQLDAVQHRYHPLELTAFWRNRGYPDLAGPRRPAQRTVSTSQDPVFQIFRSSFTPPLPRNPTKSPVPSYQTQNSTPSRSAHSETFSILLADDNIVNQKIFTKFLTKHRHSIITVENGLRALEAFKKRRYDVVLMDISMPVMGGFESTSQIRAYERTIGISRTPIIGLTVSERQEDRDKIMRSGMDDYLCKPVLFQDLTDKVVWYGQLGRGAAECELRRFLDSISTVAVRGMKGDFVAML